MSYRIGNVLSPYSLVGLTSQSIFFDFRYMLGFWETLFLERNNSVRISIRNSACLAGRGDQLKKGLMLEEIYGVGKVHAADYSQLYNALGEKQALLIFGHLSLIVEALYISLLQQQLRGYISKQQIKIG